jgi:hypothetical protein
MHTSLTFAPAASAGAPTDGASIRDLDRARHDIVVSSSAGAPFLIAFGLSLLACAVLGLVIPVATMAWVVLFQGNLALPLAFWLERRMAPRFMDPANPLKTLSIQLAMTQIVALPAVLLVNSYHSALVPAALAAIGGGHFLPYAWLQRTRLYLVLGVLISVGAFAITYVLKREAFSWVLFYMSGLYFVFAVLLVRHARRAARAGSPR